MAGFDSTLKMLVETSPSDWLTLAGLPVGPARLIDAELASVSRLADKVLSVEGAEPYLCHLEFISGGDAAAGIERALGPAGGPARPAGV